MGRNRSLYIGGAIILGLPVLLFIVAAFGVVGVALGWFSLFGVEHPKRELARLEAQYGEEVRGLQALREIKLYEHRERLRIARATLPADAPISQDWDFREAVADPILDDQELLWELTRAYLESPFDMLEGFDGKLRAELQSRGQNQDRLTPFEREFVNLRHDPCTLRTRYEIYLGDMPILDNLEYALTHGLIDLGLWDSTSVGKPEYFMQSVTGLTFLRARALMYGLTDRQDRAFELLDHLYSLTKTTRVTADLSEASAAWVHTFMLDRVPALLVARVEWTAQQQRRLEQHLTLSAADAAEMLKLYAATQANPMAAEAPMTVNDAYLQFSGFAVAAQISEALMLAPQSVASLVEQMAAADAQADSSLASTYFRFATTGGTDIAAIWSRGDLYSVARKLADASTRTTLFQVAQLLAEHRTEHGTYPTTLALIVQSIGVDKIPVGYERDGHGYRLGTGPIEGVWSMPSVRTCD
jgi:hypothetical protein